MKVNDKFNVVEVEVNCTCHRHLEGRQRDCNSLQFVAVEKDYEPPVTVNNYSKFRELVFKGGSTINDDDLEFSEVGVWGFGSTPSEALSEAVEAWNYAVPVSKRVRP